MYKVEKNIMQYGKRVVQGGSKYPWEQMEIGDSFLVEGNLKDCNRVRFAASRWKKRHPGWSYTARIVHRDDVGARKMRIWRIEEVGDLGGARGGRSSQGG